MLAVAVLFPVACLAGVLVLAHLEETLDADIEKSLTRNAPEPEEAPARVVPLPSREETSLSVVFDSAGEGRTAQVVSLSDRAARVKESPALPAIS